MITYHVDQSDGVTAEIDQSAATMTHDHAAICSNGHTPLTKSSRRVFCNQCGVWWWWSRGEVKH